MQTTNIWAVIVAAVVAFVISAIWYSPFLFGKEWMNLTKKTQKDVDAVKAKGGVWKLYLGQLIATLITFCVLGFIISVSGSITAADGAFMGLLVWLGFSATSAASDMLWGDTPFKLVLIQTICMLLNLVIGGAIMGGWR